MHRHPCQNFHWYPLTSSKSIWPKISVAYFTKWFQPILTVGGWRMYRPFNFRLLAPAYKPTQSCKRASFWSLNPTRVRHLFLKPDLGLKANQGSYDMRNCRVTKNVVCRYTLYHTQNNNHLDQNIGTIWHKRSMLVDDNTAEYNVSQEKICGGAMDIKETF